MHYFLAGDTFEDTGQSFTCWYNMYGFIALGTALLFMVTYYYFINHPRLNKWWHWLIVLLIVGIINFIIGGAITTGDWSNGDIKVFVDASIENGIEACEPEPSACWMFGFANSIVSILFFIIFSFAFKWWSSACKRTPF